MIQAGGGGISDGVQCIGDINGITEDAHKYIENPVILCLTAQLWDRVFAKVKTKSNRSLVNRVFNLKNKTKQNVDHEKEEFSREEDFVLVKLWFYLKHFCGSLLKNKTKNKLLKFH